MTTYSFRASVPFTCSKLLYLVHADERIRRTMAYTSHGLMTSDDLEEYRRDYDWDELNPQPETDDGCVHGRLLTEDCDECSQSDHEDDWQREGVHDCTPGGF